MGREMNRRENRKNKNKVVHKQEVLDTSIKGRTVLEVVLFCLLLLVVLWYVVAVFITKEIDISWGNNANEAESTDASGVSNRILASTTFDQNEEVYLVYYYDFNEGDEAVASAISGFAETKIYRVDTSSSLNQKYVTEEAGNSSVTGISDLKVKNPTLIEVTNDSVTGYYEGSTAILNFLNKQVIYENKIIY